MNWKYINFIKMTVLGESKLSIFGIVCVFLVYPFYLDEHMPAHQIEHPLSYQKWTSFLHSATFQLKIHTFNQYWRSFTYHNQRIFFSACFFFFMWKIEACFHLRGSLSIFDFVIIFALVSAIFSANKIDLIVLLQLLVLQAILLTFSYHFFNRVSNKFEDIIKFSK